MVPEIWLNDPILPIFSSDLCLTRSRNLQKKLKIYLFDSLFFETLYCNLIITHSFIPVVDIRTMISSTVQEIWLIDYYLTNFVKWPWLSRSRDIQTTSKICLLDSVFFETPWFSRNQNNNSIIYGDMAEWPYSTNFSKWLWLTRSRDLHTLLKICLLKSLFF